MQAPLGPFLRQLRDARGLSQTQVARAAGIGRVTLTRWESGARQPQEPNLEALLIALAVSPQEHKQALSLLKTSRGWAQNHNLIVRIDVQSELGPVPHRGGFLRALRMRCGLSQEEAARRTGLAKRTLRRWENSEVQPSPAQMQTLCYALDARTEEMLALTMGHFSFVSEAPEMHNASLDELKAQAHRLHFYTRPGQMEALKELAFFLLEVQVWPFALRSEAGREVLGQVYSFHAAYLAASERWRESSVYADRALDVFPHTDKPDETRIIAGITAARSLVYRGTCPVPKSGLEVLRHWRDVAEYPAYKAWLLSDIAEYMVLSGDTQSGLSLAKRATELAAQCDNPFELYNRELNEAKMLVWAGKPEQALRLAEHNNRLTVRFLLVEVEAFVDLQLPSLAQDRLQQALQLIEARNLVLLRPQAQKLALRLSG